MFLLILLLSTGALIRAQSDDYTSDNTGEFCLSYSASLVFGAQMEMGCPTGSYMCGIEYADFGHPTPGVCNRSMVMTNTSCSSDITSYVQSQCVGLPTCGLTWHGQFPPPTGINGTCNIALDGTATVVVLGTCCPYAYCSGVSCCPCFLCPFLPWCRHHRRTRSQSRSPRTRSRSESKSHRSHSRSKSHRSHSHSKSHKSHSHKSHSHSKSHKSHSHSKSHRSHSHSKSHKSHSHSKSHKSHSHSKSHRSHSHSKTHHSHSKSRRSHSHSGTIIPGTRSQSKSHRSDSHRSHSHSKSHRSESHSASHRSVSLSKSHLSDSHSKSHDSQSQSKSHRSESHSKSHESDSLSKSHESDSHSQSHESDSLSKSHRSESHSKSHESGSLSKSHRSDSHSKSHESESGSKSHRSDSHSKSHRSESHSKSHDSHSHSKSLHSHSISKSHRSDSHSKTHESHSKSHGTISASRSHHSHSKSHASLSHHSQSHHSHSHSESHRSESQSQSFSQSRSTSYASSHFETNYTRNTSVCVSETVNKDPGVNTTFTCPAFSVFCSVLFSTIGVPTGINTCDGGVANFTVNDCGYNITNYMAAKCVGQPSCNFTAYDFYASGFAAHACPAFNYSYYVTFNFFGTCCHPVLVCPAPGSHEWNLLTPSVALGLDPAVTLQMAGDNPSCAVQLRASHNSSAPALSPLGISINPSLISGQGFSILGLSVHIVVYLSPANAAVAALLDLDFAPYLEYQRGGQCGATLAASPLNEDVYPPDFFDQFGYQCPTSYERELPNTPYAEFYALFFNLTQVVFTPTSNVSLALVVPNMSPGDFFYAGEVTALVANATAEANAFYRIFNGSPCLNNTLAPYSCTCGAAVCAGARTVGSDILVDNGAPLLR